MAKRERVTGTYDVVHHGVPMQLAVSTVKGGYRLCYEDGMELVCESAETVQLYLDRDQAQRAAIARKGRRSHDVDQP